MTGQQSILITGAAQRVGLHCANRLIEAGYHVIITCRHVHKERLGSSLAGMEVIIADFSTLEGIEGFIATLRARAPRLRAIIHNASVWLEDSAGPAAFQDMFMLHMQAPMMINDAAADLLDPDCQTDIIHLTDYSAHVGSSRHAAYCATKAGLENLTLSFAKRLAPKVKVNAIAPALIMFNPEDDQAYRTRALEKSALGIEPGPEVVYQSIRYLLDTNYVTGTSLSLNGGRHLK